MESKPNKKSGARKEKKEKKAMPVATPRWYDPLPTATDEEKAALPEFKKAVEKRVPSLPILGHVVAASESLI